MRIHLAARYDRRFEMLGVAARLFGAGHDVTSRWIEGDRGEPQRAAALQDLGDLWRAECLVSFTEPPEAGGPRTAAARGGRHVELGVGLARGIRLYIVGPRENLFHHLPGIEVCATVDDLVGRLPLHARGG